MVTTKRQLEAITRHDLSMVVTAGAGTGKTYVLVQKFLHLLQDQHCRVRDLLALTFTDKAAAEMVERVRKTITEKQRSELDHPIWKQASDDLTIAPIMTFHSFCAQILREFSVEAGLQSDFVILDEPQSRSLYRNVFDALLRRPPVSIREPLVHILAQIDVYQASQLLITISQSYPFYQPFFSRLKSDPDAIIRQWNDFLVQVRQPEIDSFFSDPTVSLAIADCIRFERIYREKPDRAAAYLSMVCPLLQKLDAGMASDDLLSLVAHFLSIRPSGKLGSQKVWDTHDLHRFREAKAFLIKRMERLYPYCELFFSEQSLIIPAVMDFFSDLGDVAHYFVRECISQKSRLNGIDFSDLIQLTKQFLSSHPDIVEHHIRPRYRYILVDEFQDTDPAHFDIILSILGDLTPDTNNLFLVGDPKQSIYLFRNADVTRFKEAQNQITGSCNGNLVHLDTSFRSSPEVICCVNHLFSHLMEASEKPWEFGYEPILVCDERKQSNGSVSLFFSAKAARGSTRSEHKESEAALVARVVKRVISEAWQVSSQDEKTYCAGYGDIAILLERRTYLPLYTAALAKNCIPYYVHGGIGFYSRQEIYDIYNLLSFLQNPYDTVALYGVLRSPYFGISDPGLYHLWFDLDSLSSLSQYETLLAFGQMMSSSGHERLASPLISVSDQAGLLRASRLLPSWRKMAGREPVTLFLSRIIKESGVLSVYGALPEGTQQIANLTKLLEMVREKSGNGWYGLADLITDLGVSISEEEREGEAALDTVSQSSVHIMTVHAAKGLEFPIVLLPDMGTTRDGALPPVLSGDNPSLIGVKIPDPGHDYEIRETPVYKALALLQREKEHAERKRLFYVATTRARDHLIFCGKQPDTFYTSVEEGKSRMDWVCTIFGISLDLAEHGGEVSLPTGDGSPCLVSIHPSEPQMESKTISDLSYRHLPVQYHQSLGQWRPPLFSQPDTLIHPISVVFLKEHILPGSGISSSGELILSIPELSECSPEMLSRISSLIFSGQDPLSVLRRYGITSPDVLTFYTSRFEEWNANSHVRDSIQWLPSVSFNTPLGPYTVEGIIDLLCQKKGGIWTVFGFMTADITRDEVVININRLAAEALLHTPVQMLLYSLQTGEIHEPILLSSDTLLHTIQETQSIQKS